VGAETLVEEDARTLGPEPLQGETEDPGPEHKGRVCWSHDPDNTPQRVRNARAGGNAVHMT